jgi:CRISPR type III-A-associated protein Csm2
MNNYENDISEIIKNGNFSKMNEFCNNLGKEISPKISTSQLRNILDSVQKIHKYDKNEIQLLLPKFAYLAGKNSEFKHFLYPKLEIAIKKIENDKHFENFKKFVEAIYAYSYMHSEKKEKEKTGGKKLWK